MEPYDDTYAGDGDQPDGADPDGLWQLTYGRTESLTWQSSFALQKRLEVALLQQRAITRQLMHEATADGRDRAPAASRAASQQRQGAAISTQSPAVTYEETHPSVRRIYYQARLDKLALHNARRVVQAMAEGWGHSEAMGQQITTVEIILVESDPEIWREFRVPSAVSLSSLHDVIQDVMGWYDSHLYKFVDTNGRVFSDANFELEDVRDSRTVALSTLLRPLATCWSMSTTLATAGSIALQ